MTCDGCRFPYQAARKETQGKRETETAKRGIIAWADIHNGRPS